ncbi:hypothetical protein COEREDRAFT_83378 [Coemansia reversa NRRL 1564]|uniref:Uncharacterized protein n=1 Tax=Coemansia reversa (strain ATCC 12441 / NRRL 1564) TaxID=763665 RepID=A0A2G5B3Q0_COERN|nr:hypothetical protein COEREDRAFT_83378 [Coemansia reversa NRRL 1564]|eukprot:PIA13611.1 hypothetical protein COEREDRAFT_83378 [Coemansia reversa NRRL 1564]
MAGLTVSTTTKSNGMYNLGRSLTGGNNWGVLSPASPTATAAGFMSGSGGPLPPVGTAIALTRNQFAVECGGVLLDPETNEVCLLFYPDTSEWRLPMGRPDTMSTSNSTAAEAEGSKLFSSSTSESTIEPSIAGCEPPAHAAQRQISQITGYRCSHLHPTVSANAQKDACAYIGPQMVEPLALQIEQRPVAAPTNSSSPRMSHDLGSFDVTSVGLSGTSGALTSVLNTEQTNGDKIVQTGDSDGDNEASYHSKSTAMQFVMSYYYIAWLTQNRFEAKAATHPVGPAFSTISPSTSGMLADNTIDRFQQPLAEVTWFKVDTAAQVLTHDTDKVALREAIHRLTRYGMPEEPFVYSSVLQSQSQSVAEGNKSIAPTQSDNSNDQQLQQTNASNQIPTQIVSDSSSATSALSDGATKADNASANRVLSPVARNFDIIRRTATSLSKRGHMFTSKRATNSNTSAVSDNGLNNSENGNLNHLANPISANSSQPMIVPKKPNVPRVFSIFYKLVGSSS